jgi:hypothetical protein
MRMTGTRCDYLGGKRLPNLPATRVGKIRWIGVTFRPLPGFSALATID